MGICQDSKAFLRRMNPAQLNVLVASGLALLGFCFCIGGLTGVWWSGTYELKIYRYATIEVGYASTLWESTVTQSSGTSTETIVNIDESCAKDGLNDEAKSRCDKVGAVRAFVFLTFFVAMGAIGSSVSWIVFQARGGNDTRGRLPVRLLLSAVSCNVIASFWALLAIIVACTFDFGELGEKIGAGGGGFVLTILSMVFCFVPSAIIETFAWRWAYRLSPDANTSTSKQDVVVTDTPKVIDLPTLVGNASGCNSGAVKPQSSRTVDLEAATPECGNLREHSAV